MHDPDEPETWGGRLMAVAVVAIFVSTIFVW